MKDQYLRILFVCLLTIFALPRSVKAEELDEFDVQDDEDIELAEDLSKDYPTNVEEAEGADSLQQYAEQVGVTRLPSGIMFRVIEAAPKNSQKKLKPGSFFKVNYEGRLANGAPFDSTYNKGEPAIFNVDKLIPGWQEAVLMMREGDKWELAIPSEYAYGEKGVGDVIPPNSDLFYTIELLEVDPAVDFTTIAKHFLMKPIPGLPIQLQIWQALVFGLYLFFRLYARRIAVWIAGGSEDKAMCSASHILVDSEKLCKELKQKINNGTSFESLAKKHSKCPSGKKGGKLGSFGKGKMVREFDQVCFDPDTKIGVLQGPIKTQFGWHLVKINARVGVNENEDNVGNKKSN